MAWKNGEDDRAAGGAASGPNADSTGFDELAIDDLGPPAKKPQATEAAGTPAAITPDETTPRAGAGREARAAAIEAAARAVAGPDATAKAATASGVKDPTPGAEDPAQAGTSAAPRPAAAVAASARRHLHAMSAAIGGAVAGFSARLRDWPRRQAPASAAVAAPAAKAAPAVAAEPAEASASEPPAEAVHLLRRRKPIRWAAGFLMALFIWLGIVGGVLWWALRDVPWQQIADGTLAPVVVMEDANGELIVQEGPFQAAYAGLDRFPDHLVDAVIAIEDRRFWDHYGIDLRGMARAFIRNLGAGQVREGGSTITQQLVKVLYLESDRTYRRKIQEVVIATWLEYRLGKEEILARYLNNIYMGAGATGVPAAARVYFDKEVEELDLVESATLAGLIRAPSMLSPLTNPDGARQRAGVVLAAMAETGAIDAATAERAQVETADLNPAEPVARSGSWFADWAIQEARQIAGPYRGTIRVRTTLVPELQEIATRVVNDVMAAEGGDAGASQAALVAMTPDGAVVAMVGGLDYGESTFNRAVQAMRQPGSTFKLFVYYAALKAGISPNDLVDDAPIEIDGWAPENFGGRFHGRVSVAEAFARSLNAATVVLAEHVGIDNVAAAARELGIDARLMETPSLALGTSEVSLLDLTGAYASVRAGIAPVEPWGIATFQADNSGRSFRVGPTRQPTEDLGMHQIALFEMLRLVVERGTGRAAALDSFAAGKTGTSQNFRDAWFVGFTEPLVVGVWVGNDDSSPMNEVTGGSLPARIWRAFMAEAMDVSPAGENGQLLSMVAGEDEGEIEMSQGPVFFQEEGSADQAQASGMACDVQACSRRYRSFRASDCTYQPYRGGRRMCTIGAAQNDPASRGSMVAHSGYQQAPQSCNVRACSQEYRSFRASDCTYQPYRGPRRICER